VRDMNGTIVAENIGEGARFIITLQIIACIIMHKHC
jgi:hypothetical protein